MTWATSPTGSPTVGSSRRPTSGGSEYSSGSSGASSASTSVYRTSPRSPSAAVRSPTSSNLTSSRDWCHRVERTVKVAGRLGPCGTVPRGVCVPNVAPTANRRSGSSVRSSTDSSPWMPCGLPMRPTTTSCVLIGPRVRGHVQQAPSPSTRTLNGARRPLLGSAPAVHVDEVDASTALAGQCTDHGAQGGGGASASSDDLAEVVRVHPHLEDGSATKLFVLDHHVVGVPDDTPNQVFERFGEHGAQAPVSSRSLSRLVCSASTVLTSIASASSVAPSGVSAPGVSF